MKMKFEKLKIVSDENIPLIDELFGSLGQVQRCSGRAMQAETVSNTDVLLVRSVTKVGPALLKNSNIQFVGTATIGTDHIDQEFLAANNIAFTSAAGSNSTSVTEYVMCGILTVAKRMNLSLEGKTLGIIGHGNIGKKVAVMARALGLDVLINDPPLKDETGLDIYREFDEVIKADIVTFHVPMEKQGKYPTWHLLNNETMKMLNDQAIIINSSRGDVVDNIALKEHLKNSNCTAIMDVWANEPDIDVELMELTAIATPHIAGYSLDGKINGSYMLYEKLCQWLEIPKQIDVEELKPVPKLKKLAINTEKSDFEVLLEAMQAVYPIEKDDKAMRKLVNTDHSDCPAYFDGLRKNYPIRREAATLEIELKPFDGSIAEKLKTLGFKLTQK
ncbi:MAG: 4-phosphoerythronate dehydrogenase [Phycisphaerae bacterium]|nr:4-phosphoerythronate dehydrogenase [Phycisphaerae bacterium]